MRHVLDVVLRRGRRGFCDLVVVCHIGPSASRGGSVTTRKSASQLTRHGKSGELVGGVWRGGRVLHVLCVNGSVRSRAPAGEEQKQGKLRATSLCFLPPFPYSPVRERDVCGRFLTRTCFSSS